MFRGKKVYVVSFNAVGDRMDSGTEERGNKQLSEKPSRDTHLLASPGSVEEFQESPSGGWLYPVRLKMVSRPVRTLWGFCGLPLAFNKYAAIA